MERLLFAHVWFANSLLESRVLRSGDRFEVTEATLTITAQRCADGWLVEAPEGELELDGSAVERRLFERLFLRRPGVLSVRRGLIHVELREAPETAEIPAGPRMQPRDLRQLLVSALIAVAFVAVVELTPSRVVSAPDPNVRRLCQLSFPAPCRRRERRGCGKMVARPHPRAHGRVGAAGIPVHGVHTSILATYDP
ncbi:MAG: hypothetical protein HYV07_26950 [Deltaproteobacteria bacterium]|nr:hypothetical protein [Deltaproteobacteria bacterium]